LESFHVGLGFDAEFLEWISMAPGMDSWTELWFSESRSGLVNLTAVRPDTGGLDTQQQIVLAYVIFRCLKVGETRIDIQQADLRASLGEHAVVEAVEGMQLEIY